ncbi:MAG: hypothetical protein MK101_06250 [Phycisphaerales bacterium]|nr:hypothetical protein [Phycisphaerales bacterium]
MFSRRRLAFGIVLALTLVAALLPPGRSRWTADVADLLRVGQMPFARMGVLLDDWLRPRRPLALEGVEPGHVELLKRERDRIELLFRQERIRADELARRVRLLESLPDTALRAPVPPTTMSRVVTGRAVSDATARIELQPPEETLGRIAEGDVVVADEARVVGRLERVTSMRVLVRPVAHPDTGPIEVALVPDSEHSQAPLNRLLLQPTGTGEFVAQIDRRIDVAVGDELMLTDPGWPWRVQGLVLARVQAIEPIDEAPLRQRVVAVPVAPPASLVQVAVVSSRQEDAP